LKAILKNGELDYMKIENILNLVTSTRNIRIVLLIIVLLLVVIFPFLMMENTSVRTTTIVSDDPNFFSIAEQGLDDPTHDTDKKGRWVLSGKIQYDERKENVIAHPLPEHLSSREDVQDASRSGVKQVVQLPNSKNLEAVLSGKNAAHLITSDKENCADSRLILEVHSRDTENKLAKSKVVGKEKKDIRMSISEFAGETVELGGYGHYGDSGCGKWAGEFTALESLRIEQKNGLLEAAVKSLNGRKNQTSDFNETSNYTELEKDYKVPSGDYPEIEHKARWWREIDEPPYRILKPGHCQLFGGWSRTVIEPPIQTCINEKGYRGKAYNKAKSDSDFRVMAVGDAVTFGQGVPDNETYPAYLESHLNSDSELGNTKYQVINYGFPSWNTRKEIQMFERHGVEYSPDLVVLQYMENDAQRLELIKQELIPQYYENLSRQVEDEEAARVISQRTAYDTERQERMNQSIEEEMKNVSFYFERLDNLSEKHNFEVLLMHYSTAFSTRHKAYVREEADRLGWYIFDSNLARSNYTSDNYLINPEDDFYLNSLGYNLTASQLKTHLKEEKILESQR